MLILRSFLAALLSIAVFAVEAAPSAPAPGPILVLGDSLSSAHRIAPETGWVHLLEQRLRGQGSQRSVVNASISGETTSGGLARLSKLLAEHRPALVIVELGANDGLRGLPLAEIRTNLTSILTAVRAAGARSALLGIELPINYGPQYREGLREMYRGLAREFNAPLVPFLLDGVALNPDLMQDDGLHPKAEGEPKVLENVWAVLGSELAPKR
ncbi:MAG: arylesterase [Rudaea sp.]|uniref:arylesterase n=1 Tax=unclassified Rudaea TaxID=2627037 RepID=UPI0010F6094B|nr:MULTISPECIES: arylesterase [unclassified Rudaea]MBN8887225.1 arylesterase [Rudaea sp.]